MGYMICFHKCITEVCRPRPLDIYFIWGFGIIQRLFFLLWRNTEFWNETESTFHKANEDFYFYKHLLILEVYIWPNSLVLKLKIGNRI